LTAVSLVRRDEGVAECRRDLGVCNDRGVGDGAPFTLEDLGRWPTGAEGVEIIAGALCFAGRFGAEDVALARRVYPRHEVRLHDGDLWVLPEGCDSVVGHLHRFVERRPEPDPPHGTEVVRAAAGRAAEATEEAQARLRRMRDRLRRTAVRVSEAESRTAATFRRVAATAAEQGRAEDARRLKKMADVLERFAQQEDQQATDR
jgi:hypothetical protein